MKHNYVIIRDGRGHDRLAGLKGPLGGRDM